MCWVQVGRQHQGAISHPPLMNSERLQRISGMGCINGLAYILEVLGGGGGGGFLSRTYILPISSIVSSNPNKC